MKLSFMQKLWLPLILSLLCLAGISIYQGYRMKETRLDERKADLTHAAELALSVVKTFGDQAAAGTMPEASQYANRADQERRAAIGAVIASCTSGIRKSPHRAG
jgi:methyl-accepting chemotaxis protein